MFEGKIAKYVGGGMFPEEDMLKTVHKHAAIAAFVVALPLLGLEWIIFTWILWHMYSTLSKKVGVEFGCMSMIVGIIVNVAITIAVDMGCTFIPIIGWLTTAGIVYLQFYLSGKAYIETLRNMK
jgi:hypothetical protein